MEKLSCGSCAACCYHFSIEELDKKFCTWCTYVKHDNPTGSCGIYETRPTACRDYRCMWLVSQDRAGQEMPLSMRPDKSYVMFSVSPDNAKHTYVHCFPHRPDVWKQGAVWEKIQGLIARGGTVEVVVGVWRNLLKKGLPVVRLHEDQIEAYQKGTE